MATSRRARPTVVDVDGPRRSFGRRLLAPKRLLVSAAVAAVVVTVLANSAFAQDVAPEPLSAADKFTQNTNLLWIVVGAALVMFMQAGFAAAGDRLRAGPRTAPTRWP